MAGTKKQAREEIEAANGAIAAAALMLRDHLDFFQRFEVEARNMENYGWAIDPTLYKSSERQAISALLSPIYQSAQQFVANYDAQVAQAQAALKKVSAT